MFLPCSITDDEDVIVASEPVMPPVNLDADGNPFPPLPMPEADASQDSHDVEEVRNTAHDEVGLASWLRPNKKLKKNVKTKTGLDSFLLNLRDQTTVMVEPGGVGKSSLINVFLKTVISFSLSCSILSFHMSQIPRNNWLELVSARSGRQKHTTSNVSLLPLRGGGYLADTPGLNRFSLSNVTKESLALCFPEIPRNNWLELVSARSGRQKHTTPNVSLLPLRGGGYLADTPGLNRFSLSNVTKESLALCFPEEESRSVLGTVPCSAFNNVLLVTI
ncbi:EngC GTPase [Artemisia annua]|uniref:EngC GTPase n=1 Tax=Artemisia annua TaxID=35608 RepID=A0A2U1PMB1_ARTAN|nr:EngC GTPase [Artemisia annua]